MNKVGLITIVDYKNYGNRLQNYAAQRVLEKIGCEVTTLVNMPKKSSSEKNLTSIINKVRRIGLNGVLQIVSNRPGRKKNQHAIHSKVEAFKEFSKENIRESEFILNIDSIPKNLADDYDYFIVGSDQIWNPIYRNGSPMDFLTFAPPRKRIAYAPSFGISEIPHYYKETYKGWLNEFSYLSVREDSGAEIIRKLTDRNATILIDPTLMLSKSEWLEVSKPSKFKPNKPFLLTYFLGDITNETENLIELISKEYNLDIVKLGSFEQIDRYATDPSEFVDYINSSAIFLTDSFHGAVFSILMEKSFIIFDRISKVPSMNSRIETLLTKFNLKDRKWECVKESKEYFNINFSHTISIINEERSKAYLYLKTALKIEVE